MRRSSKKREFIKHLLVLTVLASSLFPMYLMVVISFKDNNQFIHNPFLPDSPHVWVLHNWVKGWQTVHNYIANSIVTSIGAVALCLVMAVLTSYVLARYKFRGRSVVYYGLIATMFLPGTPATLITLFTLCRDMGMINKLYALVLIGAVGGQVVCVFILRQFIEDIPKELFESAQIDGAGHFSQIWNIVLPMSGSAMAIVGIMTFISCWNNLLLPLILLGRDELRTIPVGLMMLEGEYVKQWGELMAGYTIASIPLVVLFVFTMRLFVKGIAAGAVKG